MAASATIPGEGGSRIYLRLHPVADAWLSGHVQIRVSGLSSFSASVEVECSSEALSQFADDLEARLEALTGEATLNLELGLTARVALSDGSGTASGTVAGGGSQLSFEFRTDQSYLGDVPRQFRGLLQG